MTNFFPLFPSYGFDSSSGTGIWQESCLAFEFQRLPFPPLSPFFNRLKRSEFRRRDRAKMLEEIRSLSFTPPPFFPPPPFPLSFLFFPVPIHAFATLNIAELECWK